MLLLFPLYSQAVTLSGYLEVKRLLALEHPANKQLKSVTQAYLNGIANGFNFYAVAVKLRIKITIIFVLFIAHRLK